MTVIFLTVIGLYTVNLRVIQRLMPKTGLLDDVPRMSAFWIFSQEALFFSFGLNLHMIDYIRFYVSLKNFSPIWRHQHCRWRAAKFRPILGAQGLWARRDLYRATPTVTPRFFRSHPKDRLQLVAWGCGGSIILNRILTGQTCIFMKLGWF
jgi:hypothetical protein